MEYSILNKNKTTVSASQPAKKRSGIRRHVGLVFLALIVGKVVVRNAKYAKDPLIFMIPNFLLLTPFRHATQQLWEKLINYESMDFVEPVPIPELQGSEFSFETLRVATENWRVPVVVRGLFKDTPAIKRWPEQGYMKSKIGHHSVAVMNKAFHNKMDSERFITNENFGEAYDDVLSNPNTSRYLFFPLKSRFDKSNVTLAHKSLQLNKDVNDLVREDLELNRIWHGFGSAAHKSYAGSQIVAGRGRKGRTSGSNWHCAPGNNWFIQVAGRKYWEFLDQKYSAYMKPMRDGLNNVVTGEPKIEEMQKHLPVKFVELRPGDMLYNPDFEWHKISNRPGLSIGCPVREFNASLAIQNNIQYLTLVSLNNLFATFGLSYGLMPRPTIQED